MAMQHVAVWHRMVTASENTPRLAEAHRRGSSSCACRDRPDEAARRVVDGKREQCGARAREGGRPPAGPVGAGRVQDDPAEPRTEERADLVAQEDDAEQRA